jgi:hypothetical protein
MRGAGELNEMTWLVGDGFRSPPDSDEYEFWSRVTAVCNRPPIAELLFVDSSELCDAVHEELEVVDVTEVRAGHLYLGTIASAESALALAMLGVRGLVAITDSDVVVDGLHEWTSLPVLPVTPAEELSTQLDQTLQYMRVLAGPVLVISADGNGMAAALCAAAVARLERLQTAACAIAEVEKRRGSGLQIETDHLQSLAAFCSTLPSPPPPPPGLSPRLRAQPVSTPVATSNKRHLEATSPVGKISRLGESERSGRATRPSKESLEGWSGLPPSVQEAT